jgi:hypothetical protein
MITFLKRNIVICLLLVSCTTLHAQKETNLLKKHEIQLLTLLLSDSTNNTTITLNNAFNFGLENELFTNSNIIKRGKDVYFQPLGTGRLYRAVFTNGKIDFKRIDNTTHSGVNFFAQNFFIKDTLFQMGGLGFWQIRGILNYYSKKTNQWELVQANRSVQTYFDNQKDAIIHFDDNRSDPKVFVSNAYYYPNYPSSFETAATDSCYAFDINTRSWTPLGKITEDYRKIFEIKRSHEMDLHVKNLYITQSQLEFFWVDFERNQLGTFNSKENNRLREIWLSVYNNDKMGLQSGFQFNLGNDLYFVKLDKNNELSWTKTTLNLNEINAKDTLKIYTTSASFTEMVSSIYNQHKSIMILILLILFVVIIIRLNIFKSKKIPKEVVTILYDNFFTALTIIEKELIEALYQSNLKGEQLSTKTINKIIGVQQKDTLTQNKSRSDHFIKINQKFKMSTQNAESLFIKTRDSADKRQYNYSLNPRYIQEIEKLLKD